MSKIGAGWTARLSLLFLVACGPDALAATPERPTAPVVKLAAAQSTVSGDLKKRGEGSNAVIHFWNRTQDRITWSATFLSSGRYCVRARYALDPAMAGGEMAIQIGADQLTAPVKTTGGWSTFATIVMGEINVKKGAATITLRASRLPTVAQPALPDLMWLLLEMVSGSARKHCR